MTAIPDTEHRTKPNIRRRRSALFDKIDFALQRVARESKLAYQFCPGSYTLEHLNAVNALYALVKQLRDEEGL
jgi:hypothetical protein